MEIEKYGRISSMDAIFFALALEVALLQIRVIEGSSMLRSARWDITHKRDRLKMDKLIKDRKMTENVIKNTIGDLLENGKWSAILEAVTSLLRTETSAISKRQNYERLSNKCDEMAATLNIQRREWSTELRNADQKIAVLRDKMKDNTQNLSTRLLFAEKWLMARAEALDLSLQRPKVTLPNAEHENRIHDELLKIFEIQIKKNEQATGYWRLKYADDIATINERLTSKLLQLQVAMAKHEELQKLYDLHAGEIRSWLNFKQLRAERLAREERVRTAATRIQKWWRGLMVRKCLGTFRFLKNLKKTPSKSKKK